MTTYETLRTKIVKHVPEIVELKFGCEIKWLKDIYVYIYEIKSDIALIYREKDGFHRTEVIKKDQPETTEIVGRPIQLADVLRAMAESQKKIIGVDFNGMFLKSGEEEIEVMVDKPYWNVYFDLSGQSEDTLAFLNSIIE